MAKVDLHIHSNFSDGSDSISELIKKIKEANIEIFALTDHDDIAGCVEIANQVPSNIRFIPSIELTSTAKTVDCHILGFGCNPNDEVLNDLIQTGKKLRLEKTEKRIQFLHDKWGIDLTKDEKEWLFSRRSPVKTHFANILVNRGLSDNNVDAMKKYFDGCKTGKLRFNAEDAVNAIVHAGGIPVWAHPLGGEGEKHIARDEFFVQLEIMKNIGIKGLECYYSRYSKAEINFLAEVANQNGLLISGGSDYHGTNKIGIGLAKLNTDNEFVDSKLLSVLNCL